MPCKKSQFSGLFCSKRAGDDQKKTKMISEKDIRVFDQKRHVKNTGDDQKKLRRFMWQKEDLEKSVKR